MNKKYIFGLAGSTLYLLWVITILIETVYIQKNTEPIGTAIIVVLNALAVFILIRVLKSRSVKSYINGIIILAISIIFAILPFILLTEAHKATQSYEHEYIMFGIFGLLFSFLLLISGILTIVKRSEEDVLQIKYRALDIIKKLAPKLAISGGIVDTLLFTLAIIDAVYSYNMHNDIQITTIFVILLLLLSVSSVFLLFYDRLTGGTYLICSGTIFLIYILLNITISDLGIKVFVVILMQVISVLSGILAIKTGINTITN